MRAIFVYNSLSGKVEELKVINPGKVKIYFCGPTVYNDPHLGNFRPPLFFDFMHRFLSYCGYQVEIAHNITDVDDRIIDASAALGIKEQELTDRYFDRYCKALNLLNILPFDYLPKATENIDAMISLIEKLIENGFAYKVNGNVYYRSRMMPNQANLANINHEELEIGARIEENPEKENPMDFVLWKKTTSGINWPSPFSSGRPGWHTECVAMINNIFHSLIDIHGGGFDLKFPHHSNEIAQSFGAFNHNLANYWIHVGFLNMNNVKMSKSLGNIITGLSALEKFDGNAIRMTILSSHYRSPINFNDEIVTNAGLEVDKILSALHFGQMFLLRNNGNQAIIHFKPEDKEMDFFLEQLSKDFNIANGLAVIHEVVKKINLAVRERKIEEVARLENILYQMIEIIGFSHQEAVLKDDDLAILAAYELARANKDYMKSDQLRNLLIEKRIM